MHSHRFKLILGVKISYDSEFKKRFEKNSITWTRSRNLLNRVCCFASTPKQILLFFLAFKMRLSKLFTNKTKKNSKANMERALGPELWHPKVKHCWDPSLLLWGLSGNGEARSPQRGRVIWGGWPVRVVCLVASMVCALTRPTYRLWYAHSCSCTGCNNKKLSKRVWRRKCSEFLRCGRALDLMPRRDANAGCQRRGVHDRQRWEIIRVSGIAPPFWFTFSRSLMQR